MTPVSRAKAPNIVVEGKAAPLSGLTAFLDHFPVATVIALVATIAGAADLCIDGSLSSDFQIYLALVAGLNGTLAIGRGLVSRKS